MGISTISIGKVKFNWRGNWAAATVYAKDDVVKYGPSVYTKPKHILVPVLLPQT